MRLGARHDTRPARCALFMIGRATDSTGLVSQTLMEVRQQSLVVRWTPMQPECVEGWPGSLCEALLRARHHICTM
jgi:hypothetical protein